MANCNCLASLIFHYFIDTTSLTGEHRTIVPINIEGFVGRS